MGDDITCSRSMSRSFQVGLAYCHFHEFSYLVNIECSDDKQDQQSNRDEHKDNTGIERETHYYNSSTLALNT